MSDASQRVQVNGAPSFMDEAIRKDNPFRPPDDETIFTFKEEEKQRRLIERERNRKTKIWDKNRPVREGCLKRLTEDEIKPSSIAIDEKFSKKINISQAAEFTIPVERPRNKENRWKLIEKKREMDLIKEMIATKRKETEKIEALEKKRIEALDESEKFLSDDIKAFVDYFKKHTQLSKDAIAEADTQKVLKVNQRNLLKEKEANYQKVLQAINKNLEILEEYFKYKKFLDGINSTASQREQEAKGKQRVSTVMETQASENVHEKQTPSTKKGSKAKKKDILEEINIKQELKDLIDENKFDYEIKFDTPSDLLKNFTSLEEKNLFLIQQTQEAEQSVEEKKHEFNKVRKQFDKELSGLQQGLIEVNERIDNTKMDMREDLDLGNETNRMPLELEKRLKRKIKEVYEQVTAGESKVVESNNSSIYLLTELEKKCEGIFLKIHDAEHKLPADLVSSAIKDIQKERKNQNIRDKKERQLKDNKRKMLDDASKNNKVFESHRPLMQRSRPKMIKKKVENDNKLSKEDEEKIYYLGFC